MADINGFSKYGTTANDNNLTSIVGDVNPSLVEWTSTGGQWTLNPNTTTPQIDEISKLLNLLMERLCIIPEPPLDSPAPIMDAYIAYKKAQLKSIDKGVLDAYNAFKIIERLMKDEENI